MSELSVDRGGFKLRGWTTPGTEGTVPVVVGVHETATSSAVWRPLAAQLGEDARVVAYDRRGWGESGAPADYRRTTIEEQAADAEAVITGLGVGAVTICGAGIGAVIALELAVRRPQLVRGALLVEPPLLALVPEATPVIAADVEAIRRAVTSVAQRLPDEAEPREVAAAGADATLGLYRSGGLGALGAGIERVPDELAGLAEASPFALFAEVAAISGWSVPLRELPALTVPAAVLVASSTPPFVRRAAEALATRLPDGAPREIAARGLPQLDSPGELARTLSELC